MTALSAYDLTKYYPETRTLANDSISIELERGQLHAIVGENGAGKSTLARILAGLETPDSGRVLVRGKPLRPGSVRAAESAGIGFVPQVSLLAPELSVAENLTLGRERKTLGFFVSSRRTYVEAALMLERYGINLDPAAPVSSLSVAERRQAEIARALTRGGDILILDEPTSVLSEAETASLFELLRRLADSGSAIAFITHRVPEVLGHADRVTVLRSGAVVASMKADETDQMSIAALMAKLSGGSKTRRTISPRPRLQGAIGLEIQAVRLIPDSLPVSVHVRRGEIVAVSAFAGNGLDRLEAFASAMTCPREGRITIEGRDLFSIERGRLRRELLAYVPSDREGSGMCLSSSIRDNLLALRLDEYRGLDWICPAKRNGDAAMLASAFGIEVDLRNPAWTLSGGNRQRAMLSRELSAYKPFAVLAEPLQSLDTESRNAVIDTIRTASEHGSAVLVLTSSVEDALELGDRIIALYRGRVVYEREAGLADTHTILAAMAGSTEAA